MTRTLALSFALIAASAAAQPRPTTRAGATPADTPAAEPPSAVAAEPVSTRSISVEAGGMSALAGIRYEQSVSARVRASVGYSRITTGDYFETRTQIVPVSVSLIQPLSRRWALDGGLGILLHRSADERGTRTFGDLVIVSNGDVRYGVIPALNAGARFEGRRLYARAGATMLAVRPQYVGEQWRAFPVPTLGAGFRF